MEKCVDKLIEFLDELSKLDLCGSVHWQVKDGIPTFYLNCNDLFAWACADAEEITLEDIPALKKAEKDCHAIDFYDSISLFCCRKRKMRPQKAWFRYFVREKNKDAVIKLFEECGPERDM